MLIDATYRRPWLYPKQREAIFNDARIACIEASTKSGKTVGCLIWLVEQALHGKPGRAYWWVAPTYAQARIAWKRALHGLPRAIVTANASTLTILLANGATLAFRSGDNPDALYGEDVWAAVIDEASRVRPEAWHAVRSTITATRGPIRVIGNVRGSRNWAYALARQAEAGATDMAYARITAADAIAAGILHEDEVDAARRQLPSNVFTELYEARAVEQVGDVFRGVTFADAVPTDGSPVIGIDLAYTRSSWSDYSVAVVVVSHGDVMTIADVLRGQWEAPAFGARLQLLARSWPGAIITAAVSGTERGVVDFLTRDFGLRIRAVAATNDKLARALPAAAAWNTGRLRVPRDAAWLADLIDELQAFRGDDTTHDDQVDALASAVTEMERLAHQPPILIGRA